MITPLTGGTLLKFRRDHSKGILHVLWCIAFDVHRFADLFLHLYFWASFKYRVDHLASFFSHAFRYAGRPLVLYESIRVRNYKLEYYVDCIGQFVSMAVSLGLSRTGLGLLAHLLLRQVLMLGMDVSTATALSPHLKTVQGNRINTLHNNKSD